jgi:putative membrane protein
MWNRVSGPAVASAALALGMIAAGCRGRTDDAARETAAADSVPTAQPDTAIAGGSAELSDANIVALLDAVNKADSSAGALALQKATSPEVKRFARLMTDEHHALRLAGEKFATSAGISPALPANDPVTPMAQQEESLLKSTPKGPEFDRTYMDQEIGAHRAAKDLLDKAKDTTDNEELKALITKAQPVVQKHLDRAEAIQKQLGQSA